MKQLFTQLLTKTVHPTCAALVLWVLGLAAASPCLAQSSTQQPLTPPVRNDIIPPAPTAASLGKYGDLPVGNYTGKPNISIPLGQITSGTFALPLSLNYSAGVQVEQIASWVGMGWSLNAGGVITRVVHGLPDEDTNGFFNKAVGSVPDPAHYTMQEFDQFWAYAKGEFDSQPDVYYFNLPGKSGRFVQNQDRQIQVLPYQKLKIEAVTGGWQLTAEDGTRYLFKAVEYSATSTTVVGGGTPTVDGQRYFPSSWFLSDIITVTNDHIEFQYTDYDLPAYPVASSETKYYLLGGYQQNHLQTVEDNYTYTRALLYQGKHLSKIIFPNGEVDFTLGFGRCDLLGDNVLQKVTFRRTSSPAAVTKAYELDYRYLNGNSLVPLSDCTGQTGFNVQSRLFLTGVKESGGSEQLPPYGMEYWLDGILPPRVVTPASNSSASGSSYYGQDHWGYFNGRNNTTLVPAMTAADGTPLPGADRSPVLAYARLGSLKTLTYPTGGNTSFEWELHDFVPPAGVGVGPFTPPTAARNWSYNTYPPGNSNTPAPIVINNAAPGPTRVTVTIDPRFPCSCIGDGSTYDALYGGCTVSFIIRNRATNQQVDAYTCKFTDGSNMTHTLDLANGEYYLTTSHSISQLNQTAPDPVYPYGLALDWVEQLAITTPTGTPINNINIGGGLRIAKLTDYDPTSGQSLSKTYEYKAADGTSSGELVSMPEYKSFYVEHLHVTDPNSSSPFVYGYHNSYMVRYSASQAALGSTQGSTVGYAKVTVYAGPASGVRGIAGKTEYYYTSPNSNPDWQESRGSTPITPAYPFAPNDSRDWDRGLLLRQVDFRREAAEYKPVKEVLHTYRFYEAENTQEPNPNVVGKYVAGVKVGFPEKIFSVEYGGGQPVFSEVVSNVRQPAYTFFKYRSGYYELASTAETAYDQYDPAKTLTSSTSYAYGLGHLQLSETVQQTSTHSGLRTTFKYPSDYAITGTANSGDVSALQRMQQLNMLTPVVEKQTWVQAAGTRGWLLVHGELTKFTSLTVPAPVPAALNPVTVVPAAWLTLDPARPLASPAATTVTGGALTYDPAYALRYSWAYDPATAKIQQVQKDHDVPTSYVWGYNNTRPIAEIKNATPDQVAYTSFEANSPGGWAYDAANSVVPTAFTGTSGYGLGGSARATVSRSGLAAGTYELLLWAHGTPTACDVPQVNGTTQQSYTAGPVVGYWHQHRYAVTVAANATLEIATPGYIWVDEVRLHPAGAHMTSFTYAPLTGVTSQTDANGRTTRYEYDGLQRLRLTRDQELNILQRLEYNYRP